MPLPDLPLPLALSTEFMASETFSVSLSVDEDDICFKSDSVFIKVRDSDATPAGRSYVNVAITVPASSVMVDNVSLDPLGTLHASPSCSLPSLSPKRSNLSLVACHDLSLIHI